jgi:hypothetical protein
MIFAHSAQFLVRADFVLQSNYRAEAWDEPLGLSKANSGLCPRIPDPPIKAAPSLTEIRSAF